VHRPLRFGVLGCGGIANRSMIPALRASEHADLVAVASRSPQTASATATRFDCEGVVGYEALLARTDLDAIYIALPIGLHHAWALAAARRGLHVLCEKSLAGTLAECEAMVACAEQEGVALLEGFAYQFHPNHEAVRDAMAAGAIGDPIQVRACFGFPPLPDGHRYDPALGGGSLNDVGAYCVHAARMLFAAEPRSISATLDCGARAVDVHGAALLDFGAGRSAVLGFGFDNMYRNLYEVWGTTGVLTVNRVFSIPPSMQATLEIARQNGVERRMLPAADHFLAQVDAFCAGVHDPAKAQAWRDEALAQARAMERLRR
jgi:dTDP-3,4-didehydro-2,6-dideoxy-alpha-D-glucose 3-reductase